MKLFDAHCHLQDERFASELAGTLSRAHAAGIERMMCCGTSESDWGQVRSLCSRHSALLPAFGLHPWYIKGRSRSWLRNLTDLLLSEPGAIIGEVGLDHALKERNDAEQAEVFAEQLRLAKALSLPICIHCRQAWDAVLSILGDMDGLAAGFMLHSYSGSVELIRPLAQMGAYFSFSGSITRHRNERGHASAGAVPLDRILIETDSPDLAPIMPRILPDAPQLTQQVLNEPANLVHVLRRVAELRNMSETDLASATWQNACRLFASSMSETTPRGM